ncbi:hypothetical protein HQN87_22765 [Paenibacillus tritici]|uniref:Uncharacterized protein n=1 Tax=Paenibacillus tritici TaxID=1873425 RepID=A0ABX2DVJ3_9BACL|nr:hypothetical protein [Paenibacillus tritici]NQX48152.1 hypothetical protein [Paenibacillus tritici]QUL56611.1 hypothetical protein KDC22_09055 [Paenibacillus tritici]
MAYEQLSSRPAGRRKRVVFVEYRTKVTWNKGKIGFFTKALEYLTCSQEIPDISIDDVRYAIYNDDSKKIKTRTFDTKSGLMFGTWGGIKHVG